MTLSEKIEISKLIIENAIYKYPKIFATCSFGKDSRVIVDLAMKVKKDIIFLGIDTGYEFLETISFADDLVRETSMNFRWLRPDQESIAQINSEYGDAFIKNGQYKCCAMKAPAIKPAIDQFDAWITGIRRDETEQRNNTPIIELKENIVKINPIAFWTVDDVWQYIKEYELSYHPLYDEGYPSLGCKPCTVLPLSPSGKINKNERSGRFVGSGCDGEECGLHLM